ncbi:hypothetical protein [Streptomyces sp. NPDC055210]
MGSAYARQLLADEANDLRHRFLATGVHVADARAGSFADELGHPGRADCEAAVAA